MLYRKSTTLNTPTHTETRGPPTPQDPQSDRGVGTLVHSRAWPFLLLKGERLFHWGWFFSWMSCECTEAGRWLPHHRDPGWLTGAKSRVQEEPLSLNQPHRACRPGVSSHSEALAPLLPQERLSNSASLSASRPPATRPPHPH